MHIDIKKKIEFKTPCRESIQFFLIGIFTFYTQPTKLNSLVTVDSLSYSLLDL